MVHYDLIFTKDGTLAVNVEDISEEKPRKVKIADTQQKKASDIILDTNVLLEAIDKGFSDVTKKSLALTGEILTVKDGWVVKVDEKGNVVERLEELKDNKDSPLPLD